jgi:V8-like Glu-specific endopeptidase
MSIPSFILGEFPYQVCFALQGRRIPKCGGSIIAPSYALTAKHCLEKNNLSQIEVLSISFVLLIKISFNSCTSKGQFYENDHSNSEVHFFLFSVTLDQKFNLILGFYFNLNAYYYA